MKTLRRRVFARLSIGGLNECWEWRGAKSSGYGQVWSGGKGGRNLQVHRVVYEILRGEAVPSHLTIDHLCRNRACSNPKHLEVVSMRKNVLRGTGPTAENAKKTHCIRGHELTEDNVYRRPGKNGRECRVCKKAFHSGRGPVPAQAERS